MRCSRILFAKLCLLFFVATCSAQSKASDVAASFLPPGTRLAALERFDSKTGKPIESLPAVLTGHFISPKSDDIVFAYVNKSTDSDVKALFVTVLHKVPEGYAKVFEKTYYERFLWVQDFVTVGLKTLRLPGKPTDSVAVATARGASLGVQVELYNWEDGLGMVNLMPSHPSAHRFSFIEEKEQFRVQLSFEKYRGEKGVPPPAIYRWDGRQLTRATG